MTKDEELWAYDEPHESGGNCYVTMTRQQAMDWMRSIYPYPPDADESCFWDWVSLHWAYKVSGPSSEPSPEQSSRF